MGKDNTGTRQLFAIKAAEHMSDLMDRQSVSSR